MWGGRGGEVTYFLAASVTERRSDFIHSTLDGTEESEQKNKKVSSFIELFATSSLFQLKQAGCGKRSQTTVKGNREGAEHKTTDPAPPPYPPPPLLLPVPVRPPFYFRGLIPKWTRGVRAVASFGRAVNKAESTWWKDR